jgi:hypothetical protein
MLRKILVVTEKWGSTIINSNTSSQTNKNINIKYTTKLICEDKNVPRIQSHLDNYVSYYSKGVEFAGLECVLAVEQAGTG